MNREIHRLLIDAISMTTEAMPSKARASMCRDLVVRESAIIVRITAIEDAANGWRCGNYDALILPDEGHGLSGETCDEHCAAQLDAYRKGEAIDRAVDAIRDAAL